LIEITRYCTMGIGHSGQTWPSPGLVHQSRSGGR